MLSWIDVAQNRPFSTFDIDAPKFVSYFDAHNQIDSYGNLMISRVTNAYFHGDVATSTCLPWELESVRRDERRFNVLMTRAKRGLIVLGKVRSIQNPCENLMKADVPEDNQTGV